jgi:hypothetical protein
MKVKVYGESDDLLELEEVDGEFNAEFSVGISGGPFYVAFSSGTLLRASYDGFWHIVALERGNCKVDHRSATDENNDYSDVMELECVDGFSWVVWSVDLERLSGQLDFFES